MEIEFAVTFKPGPERATRIGSLQARPLLVSSEEAEVGPEALAGPDVLVASESVLGNGVVTGLSDVIYVRPDRFDPRHSRRVAEELEAMNREIAATDRKYVLIGFGRWGSSEPWLGIPVRWAQIICPRTICP